MPSRCGTCADGTTDSPRPPKSGTEKTENAGLPPSKLKWLQWRSSAEVPSLTLNREDNTPIGIAAAVAYGNGREIRHSERPLGPMVAVLDTELAALDTGISLILTILPTTHLVLISPDSTVSTAICNITKPGPHPGQAFSLSFRQKADILLSLKRNLKIQVVWAPQDRSLHSFVCAKHLTNTITPGPLPPNHSEPLTISCQRREAKASAIDTWANHWLNNNHHSQTYIALRTAKSRQ
jgi:hypothetical protein